MRIVKAKTCPYNPKSDGIEKHLLKTIIDILSRVLVNVTKSYNMVPLIIMAYRASWHNSS